MRLAESSDKTWFYMKPFNIQMLQMYQMMLLKYALYYIANMLLVKKKNPGHSYLKCNTFPFV